MAKQISIPKPTKVPHNWCWIELGKLTSMKSGFPFDSKRFTKSKSATNRPLIRIRDVVNGATETYTDQECPEEYVIKKGDILIGMDGDFNVGKWQSEDALLNQRVCCIQSCSSWYLNDFLFYYLPDPLKKINDATPSVTVKHLSTKTLAITPVPVPPLPEQQRIVDRIESLFAKLDEAKQKAQDALDSFEARKLSILSRAFSGEYTSKWRNSHVPSPVGAADACRQTAQQWTKKEQKLLVAEQDKICFEAKSNGHIWMICTIGAVARISNGSTPSRSVDAYWNGDIPWVSSGEVKNNIIYETAEKITQTGFENTSVKLLPIGTVLIAMIGEGKTRGQSAILQIPATTNQNVAAIIVDSHHIDSKYLWYWLQMNYAKNREIGGGSGQQALNCQRVRELDFKLPSIAEQSEIVRILDDILAKEQQAKEAAEKVLEQIDLTKKAILARAFRGELGTNDPSEESAVELLKETLQKTERFCSVYVLDNPSSATYNGCMR